MLQNCSIFGLNPQINYKTPRMPGSNQHSRYFGVPTIHEQTTVPIVDIVRRIDRCYNSRSRLVGGMVCGTKPNTGGPGEDSISGFCTIVVDEKVYSIEVTNMRHRNRISWICQVSTIVPVSTVSCTNT